MATSNSDPDPEHSDTTDQDDSPDLQYPWDGPPDQTFADVGGLEGPKRTLRRTVIDPLRGDPERYERFGVPIPNILLSGPPGTGKTYLARSLAGEAMLPWVRLTGGAIQSKWINNSTNRVTRLFKEARWIADEYEYALVFLDEIDTILSDRDRGDHHAEDRKLVNEFLRVLEHTTNQDILVVGATNRPEALDPAATRTGRFDRHIEIGLPDTPTRKAILESHLDDRPTKLPDDALVELANNTDGWTGAQLAELVVEAARVAIRNDADAITPVHLEVAYSP